MMFGTYTLHTICIAPFQHLMCIYQFNPTMSVLLLTLLTYLTRILDPTWNVKIQKIFVQLNYLLGLLAHIIIHHMCMWLWYLPVKYANIRIANFGSIIAVSDTCVATSNGSDILKESDTSSVEFILFWKES